MRATVVSAAGLDLTALTGTFGSAGITEAWVLGNDAGDRMLFDPMPDLLICVLDPRITERVDPSPQGFTNLDVMIRAGQAAERGVPTLIIAPPPLSLSALVASATVAYCPLDREQALADHVWAFAQTAQPGERREIADSSRLVAPQRFEDDLRSLNARFPERPFYEGVERLVVDLLREAGAALPSTWPGGDLAFIASKDAPGVMLIEVKAGRLTERVLSAAAEELQQHVNSSRAKLGVLVYYDVEHKHPRPPARPLPESVIRISLEQLIRDLSERKLPEVIGAAVTEQGSVTL